MTCNFMKNKSEVQMTMEFFEKYPKPYGFNGRNYSRTLVKII
jgi:hypothetical protein